MVRLQNDEGGATKRSRPASSLDYKADPNQNNMVVGNDEKASQHQESPPPPNDHSKETSRDSGIPPAGFVDKDDHDRSKRTPLNMKSSSKPPRAEQMDKRNRLELLKQQGVPYQQWGVLIAIAVAVAWQVYKWSRPRRKNPSSRGGGVAQHQYRSIDEDAMVKELEGSVQLPKSAGSKKKSKKQKAKKKQPAPPTHPPPTAFSLSPVHSSRKAISSGSELSLDYRSSDEIDLGEWTTVAKSTRGGTAERNDSDAETVHTSNTTANEETNHNPVPSSVARRDEIIPSPTKSVSSGEPLMVDEHVDVVETIPAVPQSAPATNGSVKRTNKKKKKKKKAKAVAAASPPKKSNGSTDADAAFAQQLQLEEDQLAATQEKEQEKISSTISPVEEEEEVWEEVIKKK